MLLVNDASGQKTFDEKARSLYKNTVPLIHSEELVNLQDQDSDYYLLDVRSEKEFDVSRIKGAELVDYDQFKAKDVKEAFTRCV